MNKICGAKKLGKTSKLIEYACFSILHRERSKPFRSCNTRDITLQKKINIYYLYLYKYIYLFFFFFHINGHDDFRKHTQHILKFKLQVFFLTPFLLLQVSQFCAGEKKISLLFTFKYLQFHA